MEFLFHPATAEGEGGIAILELYGRGAAPALEVLFVPRGGKLPREGEVRLGEFMEPGKGSIDEVQVAQVAPGCSWCGLAGWAVFSHGGPMVQQRLRAVLSGAGGREADRARVVEVACTEGALDRLRGDALIFLPTSHTARAAGYLLRMAAGELSARLGALLEDLETRGLGAARSELHRLLEASTVARRLVTPSRFLIAGRPNVGKSSLYNRLAERERAIVTPLPGTTRDILQETVAMAGYPVVFIDGAGLRPREETADPVEREGVRRVLALEAEAVLFLIDHPGPVSPDEARFLEALSPENRILVHTKADLQPDTAVKAARARGECWISSLTGSGLDDLRDRIRRQWLGPPEETRLEPAPFTREQKELISRIVEAPSVDEARKALLEWL